MADAPKVIPFPRDATERPFIRGRCFSDLYGATAEIMKLLWQRGVVFVTRFEVNGEEHFGNIIAATPEQAERLAAERAFGESVLHRSTESMPEE